MSNTKFDAVLGRVREEDMIVQEVIGGSSSSTGPIVGSTDWGTITGTLADQLDLQAALELKANLSLLAGGTTGQVLTKDSNADQDYSWQTPASTTTGYTQQDYEKTGTYVYVSYTETGGAWYIYRRTIASNTRQYATGATDYATNWTNRGSQTYVQQEQEIL